MVRRLDVFADAISRSWIDRPALARQAELAGANRHRPGTLPPEELRSLLDQQAQLSATLDQLRADLDELPRDYQWTRHDLDRAKQQLESTTARLEAAHHTIAQHDRPFRRKGHETAIRDAHRDIDTLPVDIRDQRARIEKLSGKIHDIERRLHRAEQLDQRRPTLETQHADIDARLIDDRRIRTRQIRRVPPGRIVDTIGPRPNGGQPSRSWDSAAGRIDQHQTAFGLTKGLGPTKGRKLPMGFQFSRALAASDQHSIEQAITRERQQARQIEGPALRIR